jgi:hypothetical protein
MICRNEWYRITGNKTVLLKLVLAENGAVCQQKHNHLPLNIKLGSAIVPLHANYALFSSSAKKPL